MAAINYKAMEQVIIGVCPSKSNSYVIGTNRMYKTDALVKYEKSFYLQCSKYRNANITGLFEFEINVYYPSNRSDLDGCLKVVLDCLQHVNAIKNDNNCVKIVAQKFIDKSNPRIEFTITKL